MPYIADKGALCDFKGVGAFLLVGMVAVALLWFPCAGSSLSKLRCYPCPRHGCLHIALMRWGSVLLPLMPQQRSCLHPTSSTTVDDTGDG